MWWEDEPTLIIFTLSHKKDHMNETIQFEKKHKLDSDPEWKQKIKSFFSNLLLKTYMEKGCDGIISSLCISQSFNFFIVSC